MKKYAVCWIGYKMRPFLEKCIASISRNKRFNTYAYIDNCGDEVETKKIEDLLLKHIPDVNIVVRPINYKLDLNVISAMNETFNKGYDGIFYCEDDIFFDDNAFETLENLASWAEINVPQAAVFHSWNYNLKRDEYPNQYDFYFKNHGLTKLNYNEECSFVENEVGFTGQNHWGALITRRAWDTIKKYILIHYQSYINAHEMSLKTFNFRNFIELISKLQYVDHISNEFKFRTVSRFNLFGWESIYELSLLANGYLRLALTNPRSMCIEESGIDFTSESYKMLGLDKIKTINSPNVPTEFILNKKSVELFTK